jgi:acylphosphatase
VGYRNFVQRRAVSRRLGGWAQNLADGRVRVRAEGGLAAIEGFVRELEQGPPLARVDRVSVVSVPYSGLYKDFVIRLSDST